MLKTRIIPTMLVKGRELVKGSRFVNDRRVGNAISACKIHNMRGVDELCLLEVGGNAISAELTSLLASECFMPLSVGGGVRTVEQFAALIRAGADKVVLGNVAFDLPSLVEGVAVKCGSQAVVVSVAYPSALPPVEFAMFAYDHGAGEILLQSKERDGTLSGYDVATIEAVSRAVPLPVIASGGCGEYEHMAQALLAGAHAVAAGAMFQFTDRTPQGAAKYLRDCGFSTRADNEVAA